MSYLIPAGSLSNSSFLKIERSCFNGLIVCMVIYLYQIILFAILFL
jgi:hypothetical protein